MASSLAKVGRLAGKVCIVTGTGSGRGIGYASMNRFADEGARHIYAMDIDSKDFHSLQASFEKTHPKTKLTFIEADVSQEAPIKAVCEQAAAENGRLDVFFVNAGILGTPMGSPYPETELDVFMKCLAVNVGSAFLALKHAPAAMLKTDAASGKLAGGGSIVLTGSTAGLRAGLAPMQYSASKAAIMNMAQHAALHYRRENKNIRVNTVAPGAIKTQIIPSAWDKYLGRTDIFGEAVDIANAVLFLASDESKFVNAANITVDNALINDIPLDKFLAMGK